jgi:uncharacterized membrane protein YagU involved in acid resistance
MRRATTLSPAQAILYGTLVVGTLDALDAIVFFGLRSGATPIRIFQGIAAGWLGRAATGGTFAGGLSRAALGLATHYFIGFGIVVTYFVISRRLRLLTRHAILCGLAYGLLAYLVMNRVVIPLSAIGGPAAWPPLPVLANGLLIHAFGVGLPSAVFAARAKPLG